MTNELKKIIVINKKSEISNDHVWYLVEDKETKFITLNETKLVVIHYPKHSYSYRIIND